MEVNEINWLYNAAQIVLIQSRHFGYAWSNTMLHKVGTKLTTLALAAVFAGGFFATAAQATPIKFYNDVSNTLGTPRFTIGCGGADGSCTNLLEAVSGTTPLVWSSSLGQMLGGSSDASPSSETTFVKSLLGIGVAAGTAGNIAPGNKNLFQFQTDVDYFLVKVGGGPTHQAYALLHNLGGDLDLWFTATGQAGGLSHYITFSSDGDGGTPTPIPEPGILGMFGLGLLIVGAGYGLRRRRSA
jgi:hypothetical protein